MYSRVNNAIRRQLTLFVSKQDADAIEKIRYQFNPIQRELINCHVTLCREHEIEDLELIITNLNALSTTSLVIDFGAPIRFENGKGVLLPAKGNDSAFQQLRLAILKGIINEPATPEPHITLMHPRNATCTDDIFEQIKRMSFPTQIEFKAISLVEQVDGGKWRTLKQFELAGK